MTEFEGLGIAVLGFGLWFWVSVLNYGFGFRFWVSVLGVGPGFRFLVSALVFDSGFRFWFSILGFGSGFRVSDQRGAGRPPSLSRPMSTPVSQGCLKRSKKHIKRIKQISP